MAPPALRPCTTKLPNTSRRICPANIAMNGRNPRLNGRTRNDTNSIGATMNFSANGVPLGTNSEKKCSPCFQKPTPSTIAKLMIDSMPVMVNWLVTVNGCAPRIANGIAPIQLAARMKMNAVNTHGRYLRPSGPMLARVMLSTNPVSPSTAACQRPGTNCRLNPPHMNTKIAPSTISIHRAELVNRNGDASSVSLPIGAIWNWCIGSILVAAATVSSLLGLVHANYVQARPGKGCEHQADGDPRRGV